MGYQFLFPTYILDLYDKLYIPLTDKNPAKVNGNDVLKFNFNGNFQINVIPEGDPYNFVSGNLIHIKDDCIISFSGTIRYIPEDMMIGWSNIWNTIYIYKNGILQNVIKTNSWYYEITDNVEFECKEGDNIVFRLESRWTDNVIWPFTQYKSVWNMKGSGDIAFHFTMSIKPVEIKPGEKFPIIPNLPDITFMDMIHTITSMFGLFTNITESGIEFFSINDIYANIPKASNWTKKLITGKNFDEIDFSLDSFAQKNWLKYLEDNTVNLGSDIFNDNIKVNSDILVSDRDIYQMKFAASDSSTINPNIPILYIPLYTAEDLDYSGNINVDEDGNLKVDYNSVKPRICTIEFGEDTNTPRAYFPSDLFFSELISQYYSKYQQIVLHPKIIQCQFLLTDIDIYTLDVMTPVYIEQTGNYYIIQELTVNKNNVAKAKLIQM